MADISGVADGARYGATGCYHEAVRRSRAYRRYCTYLWIKHRLGDPPEPDERRVLAWLWAVRCGGRTLGLSKAFGVPPLGHCPDVPPAEPSSETSVAPAAVTPPGVPVGLAIHVTANQSGPGESRDAESIDEQIAFERSQRRIADGLRVRSMVSGPSESNLNLMC